MKFNMDKSGEKPFDILYIVIVRFDYGEEFYGIVYQENMDTEVIENIKKELNSSFYSNIFILCKVKLSENFKSNVKLFEAGYVE